MGSWLPECVVISSSVPSTLGMFVHSFAIHAFAHRLGAEHLPGGSWRHIVMSWHPPLSELKLAAWKRGSHLAVHNPLGADAGTEYRCRDP